MNDIRRRILVELFRLEWVQLDVLELRLHDIEFDSEQLQETLVQLKNEGLIEKTIRGSIVSIRSTRKGRKTAFQQITKLYNPKEMQPVIDGLDRLNVQCPNEFGKHVLESLQSAIGKVLKDELTGEDMTFGSWSTIVNYAIVQGKLDLAESILEELIGKDHELETAKAMATKDGKTLRERSSILESSLGRDLNNLGVVFLRKNEIGKAIEFFSRAFAEDLRDRKLDQAERMPAWRNLRETINLVNRMRNFLSHRSRISVSPTRTERGVQASIDSEFWRTFWEDFVVGGIIGGLVASILLESLSYITQPIVRIFLVLLSIPIVACLYRWYLRINRTIQT